jgi:glyoxylase-like metal-dependent hydrolase (beta-lactamase superfamily II)
MQPAHFEASGVRIDKLVVGPYENNAFLVRCTRTGGAVLIDAANEHEFLIPICRRLGVRQVLTTHGHWDHIQAVTAARDAGIDVAVTAADAALLPAYDLTIDDDERIAVGELRLRALHTPGHTPGSVSFLLEDAPVCFTGDTLFPGGPGTTQLDGGDFATIIQSIEQRLFHLPEATIVMPGHGLDTTVGEERPNLDAWIARGW